MDRRKNTKIFAPKSSDLKAWHYRNPRLTRSRHALEMKHATTNYMTPVKASKDQGAHVELVDRILSSKHDDLEKVRDGVSVVRIGNFVSAFSFCNLVSCFPSLPTPEHPLIIHNYTDALKLLTIAPTPQPSARNSNSCIPVCFCV